MDHSSVDSLQSHAHERREVVSSYLPMRACGFLSEDKLLVAGFDGKPVVMIRREDDSWGQHDIAPGGPHQRMTSAFC